MFRRLSTDTLNWIIIIGVLLLILEIAFFSGGLIFSALFSGVLIYVGWKHFDQVWGKVLFWVGIISIVFSILNMMAVRFVIIAGIVLFIVHYSKSKDDAKRIEPVISEDVEQPSEPILKVKPLFHHKYYGDDKTPNTAYSWSDINIHGGLGDRIIDLSNTVLPDDTAVISIRHLLGNIEIYVPYEVEVQIHHSALFGRAYIL